MKKLKDLSEKEFKRLDPSVLELHESSILCLKHDIYEGALVLSQAKLKKVIKWVLSAHARFNGISAKSVNSYLKKNVSTIDKLCSESFKFFKLNSFYSIILNHLSEPKDKVLFSGLWRNFQNTSRKVRNDTIHQMESNSPSFMVFSTKNIFYLTELIVKSCNQNKDNKFNPAKSLNRQSIPKPRDKQKTETIQSKRLDKDYITLKRFIIDYEKNMDK
jgi:hypothetical protein